MNWRREPALLLALVTAVVEMISVFIHPLTIDQQGVLNAAAVAVAGVVTAVLVHSDELAPAILGGVQALLAVGLAFHLHLDPSQQAVAMAFVTALVGVFVRTQVTAQPPITMNRHEVHGS